MNELILKVLQGRATRDEQALLDRWRARSRDNEEEYSALSALWRITGAAAPERAPTAPPDPVELIDRAEARDLRSKQGVVGSTVAPARRGLRSRPRALAAAAVAAGLVLVGTGIVVASGRGPVGPGALAEGVIATGAGEMTTLSLADGSSIRVGPGTTLSLAEGRNGQVVELEGRAFFGVQANASRRFSVVTEHGEAVAYGTRFEVRSEAGAFKVLVVDGEVEVSLRDGETARLGAGEMTLSSAGEGLRATRVTDVLEHLDWMGNTLVFQATPLETAVGEIERRYGGPIVIEDVALESVELTMTFTDRARDEVLLVLCEVVGAECVFERDGVRIRSSDEERVGA